MSEHTSAEELSARAKACESTLKEPIVEVFDKFLCIGAFEHTTNCEWLLACGIRTVMNVSVMIVFFIFCSIFERWIVVTMTRERERRATRGRRRIGGGCRARTRRATSEGHRRECSRVYDDTDDETRDGVCFLYHVGRSAVHAVL